MAIAAGVAAGIGALGSIYSAKKQGDAAKDAAKASQNAANASIAEQRRQFDLARQDQAPWLNTGSSALNVLAGLYGLNGQDQSFDQFYGSPDYQFARDQGLQGLDRSAAARGGLYSGGHSADVLDYAEGLASQQYNNYVNRLSNIAGLGQNSASQLGQMGMGMANNIGAFNTANAQNLMGSIYDRANANTNMAGQLAGFGSQLVGSFARPASFGQTQPQTWQQPAWQAQPQFNAATGEGIYTGQGSMYAPSYLTLAGGP